MKAIIYGLVGHAGKVELSLDELEVDDLELGREFEYQGRIYEIRSILEQEDAVVLNVVVAMNVSA